MVSPKRTNQLPIVPVIKMKLGAQTGGELPRVPPRQLLPLCLDVWVRNKQRSTFSPQNAESFSKNECCIPFGGEDTNIFISECYVLTANDFSMGVEGNDYAERQTDIPEGNSVQPFPDPVNCFPSVVYGNMIHLLQYKKGIQWLQQYKQNLNEVELGRKSLIKKPQPLGLNGGCVHPREIPFLL